VPRGVAKITSILAAGRAAVRSALCLRFGSTIGAVSSSTSSASTLAI
jgi:hypothetical protein